MYVSEGLSFASLCSDLENCNHNIPLLCTTLFLKILGYCKHPILTLSPPFRPPFHPSTRKGYLNFKDECVLNFKKVLKKHRRMYEFSSQNTEMFSKNNKIFSRIWHDNNKKRKRNETFWHHQNKGTFSRIYHLEMKVWKNLKKQVTIDNISGK